MCRDPKSLIVVIFFLRLEWSFRRRSFLAFLKRKENYFWINRYAAIGDCRPATGVAWLSQWHLPDWQTTPASKMWPDWQIPPKLSASNLLPQVLAPSTTSKLLSIYIWIESFGRDKMNIKVAWCYGRNVVRQVIGGSHVTEPIGV